MELKSIGYHSGNLGRNNIGGSLQRPADNEEVIAALPRPDLSQMIPFKPKVNALPGEHPVPGQFNLEQLDKFFIFFYSTLTFYYYFYFY